MRQSIVQPLTAVSLCLCLLLGACAPRNETPGAPSLPEASSAVSQPSLESSFAVQPYTQREMNLEDWWDEYLFDAAYSLQSDYPTVPQMDTGAMIEYCGKKMYRDGVLAQAGKGVGDSLLPKDTLNEYMLRYFNRPLSQLDTLKLENEDATALLYYINTHGIDETDESVGYLKNGPFTLTDAQPAEDGKFHLTIEVEGSQTETFVMAPHLDREGYYFEQVIIDYGQTPEIITLSGNYLQAPSLLGFSPSHGSGRLYSYGEIAGRILLVSSQRDSSLVSMSLVSSQDLSEIKKEISLSKEETFISATACESRILFVTSQRLITMGADFSDYKEVSLPQTLMQSIHMGSDDYARLTFNTDLSQAVYCNHQGVCLYDFSTDQATLLLEHPDYNPNAQGKEMMANKTYGSAQFIENGTKILANIYGYEHTAGRTIYDLATKEAKTVEDPWLADYLVVEDGKGLSFNVYDENTASVYHYWTDMETGEEHPITFPSGLKDIQTIVSEDKGTVLIFGSTGNRHYELYKMNLQTMEPEKTDFLFTGTDPYIIGACNNGNFMFLYFDLDGGPGAYILAKT